MLVSLTSSIDIVPNSVSLYEADTVKHIFDLPEEDGRDHPDHRRPSRDSQHHPEASRKHQQRSDRLQRHEQQIEPESQFGICVHNVDVLADRNNDKLSTKQDSITSSTTLSLSSITTSVS